jgi:ribosomal protein S18 acetylase RimI-like enzyme
MIAPVRAASIAGRTARETPPACDHRVVTTIREFQPRDGEALRELWTTFGFRLIADDDAGLDRFAARNPGLFVVAEDGSGIVGSVLGAWDGRRGWLYHVAVAPSHQRRGLGSELVALVEGRLRDLGCPRVIVMVEAANDEALRFWTTLGYGRRDTVQLGKTL